MVFIILLYVFYFKGSSVNSILAISEILRDHHSEEKSFRGFYFSMPIVANKEITVTH